MTSIFLMRFLGLLFILLSMASGVSALPYGSGKYNTCTYNTCSIGITTMGTVNLNITPTGSDVYTIDKDDVTVTTAASTGYSLQIEMEGATRSLVGATASIVASSGTVASPLALGSNMWGYRVDGVGGFGNGPTSQVTNASSSSLTFAGVPANGSPATIVSTSAAAGPDSYDIWYGVHVSTLLDAGAYAGEVVYTATTNN